MVGENAKRGSSFYRCGLAIKLPDDGIFTSHESLILGKRPWYLRRAASCTCCCNVMRGADQINLKFREQGYRTGYSGRNLTPDASFLHKGAFLFSWLITM
ncbi:hypothetical protein ACLK2A_20500 [Escherichia coli]